MNLLESFHGNHVGSPEKHWRGAKEGRRREEEGGRCERPRGEKVEEGNREEKKLDASTGGDGEGGYLPNPTQ